MRNSHEGLLKTYSPPAPSSFPLPLPPATRAPALGQEKERGQEIATPFEFLSQGLGKSVSQMNQDVVGAAQASGP